MQYAIIRPMNNANFTHHFLIAMPGMEDPFFSKSLTYICEHNEQGALGIVVNRPIELTLGGLFEQIELSLGREELKTQPVYFGGPVQMDRGFVLHRPVGDWQSTLSHHPSLGFTTSKDILQAVAAGAGPEQLLVSLGYAGWEAGQLEQEILQNGWLTVEADPAIIFDLPPEQRLEAAMRQLGIDFLALSEQAGHA